MKKGLKLELTYKSKRFTFDSATGVYQHNESYTETRHTVLNMFGEMLKTHAITMNTMIYRQSLKNIFQGFFQSFYEDKIGPNPHHRKSFIADYKDVINRQLPFLLVSPNHIITKSTSESIAVDESEAEPVNEVHDNLDDLFSGDFDFESDSTSSEDIPILKDFAKVDTSPSTLDKIDDFDNFDFTELDVTLTANEVVKKTTNKDDFDFSEFDEMDAEEPLTNAPTFMFSGAGYTLYISFNHMTFKATGGDEDVVYALQNLATLVFINHTFLTAKNHPEWLYSSFEDDLKQIFDKLTTGLTYFNDKERDIADSFIESSMYHAVLNYRNRLGYYKYHKPFVFEHE
jgi:hypothetical protein